MTTVSKEKHSFGAEVGKILHLMIHSLYEQKDIFLRELISNASDACDKLRYEAITESALLGKDSAFKIRVLLDKKARTLTVSDNGIGMSRDELIENLGTIARSGTQNFAQKLTGNTKADMNLIGQFGVGFYSSFMVAEKVEVTSRKAGHTEGFVWASDGNGEFTIEPAAGEVLRGTSVRLSMRAESDEFLDTFRLSHIIKTYSDHIAFPIELEDAEEKKPQVVNSASALWTKPKSEITPEQYKEFYHHVGHAADEPWLTLHNKAEGTLEYTSLLFIPSKRPFDLFHPDRARRVKLYVKRVFICEEEADVIPRHLRFLRGVVDSEDLPLNISRETLQKNLTVQKIRQSITGRVLAELKKKAEEDPKAYATFWLNFGSVMKEGLCESFENHEKLLEVCRFHSTAGDELTSLDSYVGRMKPGQKSIYYILGDNLEAARKSPQIEGFLGRGFEVLLLTDSVDDFWVNVTAEYKGKELISATRAGVDSELEAEAGKDESKETPEKKTKEETPGEKALIDFFKETLGTEVLDVRLSHKLTQSPACLVAPEGGMDIRLEQFLVESGQLQKTSAKVLEINPSHPLLRAIARDLAGKKEEEKLKDAVHLLFAQASIIEGENIRDVSGFSRRVSDLLAKALGA
jgi:molecular chaperone HtpG